MPLAKIQFLPVYSHKAFLLLQSLFPPSSHASTHKDIAKIPVDYHIDKLNAIKMKITLVFGTFDHFLYFLSLKFYLCCFQDRFGLTTKATEVAFYLVFSFLGPHISPELQG